MPTAKCKTVTFLIPILALSFLVRGLTTYFINTHLADPGWFQSGTYALFDRHAQDILDNKASAFWIDDPAKSEAAIYPPGYSICLALIYSVTGSRSPATVQKVQFVIDSLAVLLIVGIGISAYGCRVGLIAGTMAALSPLLALYGATPLADAPTSWIVLGAVWFLVVASKEGPSFDELTNHPTRRNFTFAALAGVLLGLSCWLRSNAVLLPLFWIAAIWFLKVPKRSRVLLGAAVLLGFITLVTPLVIRNAIAFHVLTPTGLGVGTNLWEGLGETDRATVFGAVYGDANLVEKERLESGVPADQRFELYYPDGVRRDRERTRKAVSVITAHPVWYATVILRRMTGVLKYFGKPNPFYGSSGINVTAEKCVPERMPRALGSFLIEPLGMVQSLVRHLALPLMIFGVVIALWFNWRLALLVLSTVLYYLVVGSSLHTEFRYGLPMQALLFVFAGVTIDWLISHLRRSTQRSDMRLSCR